MDGGYIRAVADVRFREGDTAKSRTKHIVHTASRFMYLHVYIRCLRRIGINEQRIACLGIHMGDLARILPKTNRNVAVPFCYVCFRIPFLLLLF